MKREIVMKRLIIFAAAIVFLASCHNNRGATEAQINQAKQEAIDSMNAVNNVKETKDMFNHQNTPRSYSHQASGGRYYGNSQSYPASSSQAPVARRKKWNWSDPAKGAVIGGAAGAAAGAIFDRKNRAAGAIIGGAIGAGAGTGAGVIIDGRKKRHHR